MPRRVANKPVVQKKPAMMRFQIVTPKKGKARMIRKTKGIQKKPALPVKSPVKYVRHGEPSHKSRGERQKFKVNLSQLLGKTEDQIVRMLVSDELLEKKCGSKCPFCKKGVLGKLKKTNGWGLRNQCRRKGCRRYVVPHHGHPFFAVSKHAESLKTQSAALLCNLAGASNVTTHKLLGHNHKVMENLTSRLAYARQRHVVKDQDKIVFGDGRTWKDGEADEATFAKKIDPKASDSEKNTSWEQWGGILQRGRRDSLVLNRLSSSQTSLRAPGPGAIKKIDWTPLAKKYLEDRKIVLHTDRAKSYKARARGMVHDSARH